MQRQLEVGAVALVGLDDEPLAARPVGAGADVLDVAADRRSSGASPASARISISIDVVVVLPCVPATPSERAWAQIDASIPARRSTGCPSARASSSSMLCRRDRGRRRDGVARRCTCGGRGRRGRRRRRPAAGRAPAGRGGRCPTRRGPSRPARWRSRSCPGPPTPTTWSAGPDRSRSSGLGGERGHGATRLTMRRLRRPPGSTRPASGAAAVRPTAAVAGAAVQRRRAPAASARSQSIDLGEPVDRSPSSSSGEEHRAALSASQRTLRVWWSSAAPDHGTRIAGVPVTATSATVLAPPRPTSRSAAA